MNTDIRISVSFRNHRKRAKLRMILGDRSTDYLLDLWLSVAMDRPDGDLHGLDAMDIAIMSGWNSDPQVLVNALVEVGFLDATTVERPLNAVTTTEYSLHDWCEHNGYASAANDRSGKSRFSRMAKTHPALYKELKEKGYDSITSEEFRRLTTVERPLTNRSSPSPSPSPSPSIKTKTEIPYDKILAAYNKFCPSLPKTISVNSVRCALIQAAWFKYEAHEGGPLKVFDTVFKKAEVSNFLTGKEPGHDGKFFKADFDWLFKEDKMVLTLEGKYDNAAEPPKKKREVCL